MKKMITLGIVVASIAFTASAQTQQFVSAKSHGAIERTSVAKYRGTATDSTIFFPESLTDTALGCDIDIYETATNGLVAGNNKVGDKEFAMGYKLSDYAYARPAQLFGVGTYIGFADIVNNGTVTAKVYADNGAGAPGTLLGTSNATTVSQLSDSTLNVFTFPAAVALTTDKFFVSIDVSALYATRDTIALYTTDGTCSSTTNLTAYYRGAGGAFATFESRYTASDDIMIFPFLVATTTAINNVVKNNFSANAYPVPANNTVTIGFIGQDNDNTKLNLKDITGKTVASTSIKTVKNGSYKVPFNVTNLSSGMYFVEIASGNNKGMLKISVQ